MPNFQPERAWPTQSERVDAGKLRRCPCSCPFDLCLSGNIVYKSGYEAKQRVLKSYLVGSCCVYVSISGEISTLGFSEEGYYTLEGGSPVDKPLLIFVTEGGVTILSGNAYWPAGTLNGTYTFKKGDVSVDVELTWKEVCPCPPNLFPVS
jgi:hypothetical protein